MILVLGGTGDGRKLVRKLLKKGYHVGVIPLSEYGEELAREDGAVAVGNDILQDPEKWIRENNVTGVVDARHSNSGETTPGVVSWASLAAGAGIPFYRMGREGTKISDGNENIFPVSSMEQAARLAAGLGKCIFLTTGSNGLEPFLKVKEQQGLRLVVRVLPEHRVIRKCQDLGIRPKDIVAIQGPFSKQVNKALFKMYRASVVVTKDSGKAGGTDTKLSAAQSLKIPVVFIRHIDCEPVLTWEEILRILVSKERRSL